MPTATLTSKGQVTVPKEVRDLLKLKKGQELDFQMAGDGQVILRAKNRDVRLLKGMFKAPRGTRATIREINETIAGAYAGRGSGRRS
jgi:antitoxin PrlF